MYLEELICTLSAWRRHLTTSMGHRTKDATTPVTAPAEAWSQTVRSISDFLLLIFLTISSQTPYDMNTTAALHIYMERNKNVQKHYFFRFYFVIGLRMKSPCVNLVLNFRDRTRVKMLPFCFENLNVRITGAVENGCWLVPDNGLRHKRENCITFLYLAGDGRCCPAEQPPEPLHLHRVPQTVVASPVLCRERLHLHLNRVQPVCRVCGCTSA